MKAKLIVVGKTDFDYIEKGSEIYFSRIKHYLPFEIIIIPALKNSKSLTNEQVKEKEGILLLNYFSEADFIVLLDEKGKEFKSTEFAKYLENKMILGKNIVFVIGGAYGFSPEVYKKSKEKLSMSQMTFSHQIIRLIFLEQFYRALTIIKGEKYHHE